MAFAYTKLMQAMVAAGVVTPTDPYFNLVTLLLPGNGTNGAQNNTFLDSSSNNFTITRNGNTTQGTFSPFSQTGWGNYFGGAGNYLVTSDTSIITYGTGAYTIEFWINLSKYTAGIAPHVFGVASIAGYPQAGITNSGYIELGKSGGVGILASTTAIPLNQWAHVALVRTSTATNGLTWYINGIAAGTGTDSNDWSGATNLYIGGTTTTPGTDWTITGYLSNFRICKAAVYTGNFTPSTTPLTTTSQGATSCVLLTCQDNRFIDNSVTATSFSTATATVQPNSPFAPTAAYSAATNGGSGYFDGTGDSLSAGDQTAYEFGAGDFTIEAWVYPTSFSSSFSIASKYTPENVGASEYYFYVTTAGKLAIALDGGGGEDYFESAAGAVSLNTWAHCAVSKSGTTVRLFVNGVQVQSGTSSRTLNSTSTALSIGLSGTAGYIANARIVKGTAVYTAAFTPPTAPLTAISGTSLLLNFTNAGITDATAKNDLETAGNASISTTQSKFGGSSMYFDGTGDYLSATPKIQSNAVQGGNATIEMWVYTSNSSSSLKCLIDTRSGQGTDTGYGIYQIANNVVIYGNGVKGNAAGQLAGNTWTHLAVTRANTTNYVFIGGTLYNTFTYGNTLTSSNVTIASDVAGSNAFTGYIDDLRITNGYARYTANFTPTTTTFPLQ